MLAAQKHPAGLATLFFTEMWERFSFYGMRALLVLYLVNALEYAREDALQIYATYTGLVYLSPILGGYLADKWLGRRHAVLIGGIVMSAGHFAMAVPSLLTVALGLLIAGNGFFKPNISTIVGGLYENRDMRRDAGFTIFYMGINLGAFMAPLICGTLGEKLGWHYGFAAAGVGMLFGLFIFIRGQNKLHFMDVAMSSAAMPNNQTPIDQTHAVIHWRTVAVVSVVTIVVVNLLIILWPVYMGVFRHLPGWLQISAGVLLILFSVAFFRQTGLKPLIAKYVTSSTSAAAPVTQAKANQALSKEEKHRVLAILIIGAFVVFFWMGFEQAGGTMNLFAYQQTDRHIFGWEVPASYFQSLNPLFILLLAPLFSVLWTRLDNSRFALSVVVKQGIGMIILGLGFVVLAIGQTQAETRELVSPLWLVAVYLLHTVGELCLSPIGLSMVTKLAPAQLVSLMMGLWMTVYAVASYLAGILESLLEGSGVPLYWFLVLTSIGAGAVLIAISPLLKRLMHETK